MNQNAWSSLSHFRTAKRKQLLITTCGTVLVLCSIVFGFFHSTSNYAHAAASSCAPQITSVSSFAAQQTQSVSIGGNCFGTNNTFSNTDSPYFKITVNQSTPSEWHACYTGDAPADSVTCSVSSWTNTSITFSGFTGAYGQNGWIVNQGDPLLIQVWNTQTNQGPGVCTVIAGKAGGTTQCNCTQDYCTPPRWDTVYANTLTPGVEPLNVIISARSTVTLGNTLAALNKLYGWSSVPTGNPPLGCLSPEEARVTGRYSIPQEDSWRLEGCVNGNILSFTGKENHARLWNQPVPGSNFGAWFITASYETACVLRNGQWLPLQKPNGSFRHGEHWHCIDGGPGSYGSNGYDNGAANLATDIVQAAQNRGWHAVMRTDPRPAGTGEDKVAFSGTVYVVTVDYTAPTV